VTWRVEDEDRIKKKFHSKTSYRLLEMFRKAHKEWKKPEWILNRV